ncbi:MAG: hypothetical protein KAQ62_24575, partial [Cyclobacteriaceae bacterium]|nr:hypothetical protein [Cyclobacteriaceae bacterium]
MKFETEITLANEEDGKELLALSRRCHMEGALTLYTDRSPDFFRIYKLLDKSPFLLIERKGSFLRGCFGSTHRRLLINGKAREVVVCGDFKIVPEARKGYSGYRLAKSLITKEKEAGFKLSIASFIKGNKASLIFKDGRAGIPKGHLIGKFKIYNIVPLLQLKENKSLKVQNASEQDIPMIVKLYNEYNKNFNLVQEFTDESFRIMLKTFPGLEIGDFNIVKRNNKIEAVVAVWDQKALQNYVLVKDTFSIRTLRATSQLLSTIMKSPRIPKLGDPMKYVYLWFVAIANKQTDALTTIIRKIHNDLRGTEYSHFSICFNENDPLAQTSLKGMIGSSITSLLYAFSLDSK